MKCKLTCMLFFAALVLMGCKTNVPVQNIQVNGVQVPVILLNGNWKFHMNPPAEFWENEVDFQSWSDIRVPGECQMQGFAIKHDQPYVYKKEFWCRLITWKRDQPDFYGVYSYARVWVNGKFVREHYGGFTRWECDISAICDPGGKGILTVEMTDRADDISYGSGYAKHQIGGILKDVELVALPVQHFTTAVL